MTPTPPQEEGEALRLADWLKAYAQSSFTTIDEADRLFSAASTIEHLLSSSASARGMREALRQLELNESELWGIRDDYIEAQYSGVYNGRQIKREIARQYAHDFGERADSAKQCADIVRAALTADPEK